MPMDAGSQKAVEHLISNRPGRTPGGFSVDNDAGPAGDSWETAYRSVLNGQGRLDGNSNADTTQFDVKTIKINESAPTRFSDEKDLEATVGRDTILLDKNHTENDANTSKEATAKSEPSTHDLHKRDFGSDLLLEKKEALEDSQSNPSPTPQENAPGGNARANIGVEPFLGHNPATENYKKNGNKIDNSGSTQETSQKSDVDVIHGIGRPDARSTLATNDIYFSESRIKSDTDRRITDPKLVVEPSLEKGPHHGQEEIHIAHPREHHFDTGYSKTSVGTSSEESMMKSGVENEKDTKENLANIVGVETPPDHTRDGVKQTKIQSGHTHIGELVITRHADPLRVANPPGEGGEYGRPEEMRSSRVLYADPVGGAKIKVPEENDVVANVALFPQVAGQQVDVKNSGIDSGIAPQDGGALINKNEHLLVGRTAHWESLTGPTRLADARFQLPNNSDYPQTVVGEGAFGGRGSFRTPDDISVSVGIRSQEQHPEFIRPGVEVVKYRAESANTHDVTRGLGSENNKGNPVGLRGDALSFQGEKFENGYSKERGSVLPDRLVFLNNQPSVAVTVSGKERSVGTNVGGPPNKVSILSDVNSKPDLSSLGLIESEMGPHHFRTSILPSNDGSIVPHNGWSGVQNHGALENTRNIAHQLTAQINKAESREIEIQLDPKELGQVRMRVSFGENGAIAVTLSSERFETYELMRRHIDVAEKVFREMGYSNSSFDLGMHHPSRNQAERGGVSSFEGGVEHLETSVNPDQKQSEPRSGSSLDIRV